VVAATMHPTCDRDRLAGEFLVDVSAVVGAHGNRILGGERERGMLRTGVRPRKAPRL
jgi:hypothetical protein